MKSKDLFAMIGIIIAVLAVLGAATYAVYHFWGYLLPQKKKNFIEADLEPDCT